eukprot:scaffold147743_cov27-Tisochrysis_lutea.AAC.1
MSRVHTVPISYGPGCHLRKGSTVTQVHHTSAQTAVGQVHRLFIAIPHVYFRLHTQTFDGPG